MPVKKVQVHVAQGAGFRTECRAGSHVVVIDQPTSAGGTDTGPTPLEAQLMMLGACIAAIGRIIANQRHLPIRGFEISVEGDLDTDRLLGKASQHRVGFSEISARVKIDADLPLAAQEGLLREIDERCPISENLKDSTPVSVDLIR